MGKINRSTNRLYGMYAQNDLIWDGKNIVNPYFTRTYKP